MQINRLLFALPLPLSLLASCVSPPKPVESFDHISITTVTKQVQCELGLAIKDLQGAHPELLVWAVGMTLTLAVDVNGSVLPSVGFSGPFNSGTFNVGLEAGAAGKSSRTALVKLMMVVGELTELHCPPPNHFEPLERALGLREWLTRVMQSDTAQTTFPEDKAIGYTLEFEITVSAGVTPSFKLERSEGKAGLGASQKLTHTLDLAMVPGKAGAVRVVRVSGKKSGDSRTLDVQKKTVVTSPRLDQKTRERLDAILRELQLRSVLPRR